MRNAISVDLEDWFCVRNLSGVIAKKDWDKQELRIVASTRRILDLLAKHGTKATFFVLGWIAERLPDLIHEIDRERHEIATHGYSHILLTDMDQIEFEQDLRKAIDIASVCTGEKIIGFRAPSFSVVKKSYWVFEILEKFGIRYDSSVFPISFHPDYGISEAPIYPYRINEAMVEFPISCVELGGRRIPCGGGGYFRLYPYWLTRSLIKRCNREGRPAVFYLHPWEIDSEQPRVDLPRLKKWRHYINLDKTFERLDRLLGDFNFTTIREVLGL